MRSTICCLPTSEPTGVALQQVLVQHRVLVHTEDYVVVGGELGLVDLVRISALHANPYPQPFVRKRYRQVILNRPKPYVLRYRTFYIHGSGRQLRNSESGGATDGTMTMWSVHQGEGPRCYLTATGRLQTRR